MERSYFSPLINIVPGLNSVDGNRIQMSKSFTLQYVPLENNTLL